MRRLGARAGFSLVEMMVALAVFAGIVFFQMGMFQQMQSMMKDNESTAYAEMDKTLAQRMIWLNVRMASPSYNNFIEPDDDGKNFFDYYPDIPAFALATSNRTRTLSLDPAKHPTFDLIVSVPDAESMLFNPISAYDYVSTQTSLSVSEKLTYAGINLGGAPGAFFKTWKPGGLFMLMSPNLLRPVTAGSVDMSVAPRKLTFVGKVTDDGKDLVSVATEFPSLTTTHPVTPSLKILSPDAFFRRMPPAGGIAPVAVLSPINVVRFSVVKTALGMNLFVSKFDGVKFVSSTMIAKDLKTLRFVRPLVSLATISFELEFVDKK